MGVGEEDPDGRRSEGLQVLPALPAAGFDREEVQGRCREAPKIRLLSGSGDHPRSTGARRVRRGIAITGGVVDGGSASVPTLHGLIEEGAEMDQGSAACERGWSTRRLEYRCSTSPGPKNLLLTGQADMPGRRLMVSASSSTSRRTRATLARSGITSMLRGILGRSQSGSNTSSEPSASKSSTSQ